MSKFKYTGYTRDDVKKAKDRKSNFDSFVKSEAGFFKASEGANNIRFLPPSFEAENRQLFGLRVFIHYNIGVDKSAYLCLNKMQNKPCPICKERSKLDPNTDEDYIRELNYQGKLLVYVLDRNAMDRGPLLWTVPATLLDDILDDSEDEETGALLNIDHPDKGYDVSFVAEGAGKRTCKYKKVRVARKSSSISDDDVEYDDTLDFIEKNALNEILNYYSYEHIAAKFGAEDTSSNTNDESPRRGRRTEPEAPETDEESPRRGRRTEPEAPETDENNDSSKTENNESQTSNAPGSRLSRFRQNRTK
jgi:hypothetical protein